MVCRRRTCQTTIDVGELSRCCDPAVSEWGNLGYGNVTGAKYLYLAGEPGELKYLSNRRKRKRK